MPDTKETTNEVLKEKIEGLTKTTDLQFSSIKENLTDIKVMMQGFATKAELQDVKSEFNLTIKRIDNGFAQHNIDDKESFGNLSKGQREAKDFMVRWGAIFGLVVSVLPFIAPIILNKLGF